MFVTKWLPYEVSIVSIPADPNVGYQRSLETEEDEDMNKEENQEEQTEKSCAENPDKKDCDEQTEEQETEEVKEQEVQEQKNQEVDNQHNDAVENTESAVDDSEEIRSLGELVNMQQLAEEYITNKRSYDEFKTAVKANKEKENNLNVKKDKDMEKFSLRKAILNAAGKLSDEEAAFERGVIEENKRRFNITDADIVISNKEIRAFDGSEAINQTVYQPGLYTPNLRPAVTVDAIGTKKVAVTGPSISFSVCTSGIAAGFVDINGNVPSASMDFALKTMTPKKEGAYVDVSYQALLQDDPSAEGIIMDDIVKALDQAKDVAFFNGTSGNNEPVGLLNVDGVNTVTIPSGGPVLSTMLEFEKKIRESYDYSADLKWVMSNDMYYKCAATPYSAKEQNKMLVDPDTRKCIGYDVYMNASLPSGTIILGNFNEALEAGFDGMTIRIVEDAQLARKQAIEIVAHRALDFLFRRPKSFTKNA